MSNNEDRKKQIRNLGMSLSEVNDVRLEREAKNKTVVEEVIERIGNGILYKTVIFTYFAPYGFDEYTGTICGVTRYEGSLFLMIEKWNSDMTPIVVEDIYIKEIK